MSGRRTIAISVNASWNLYNFRAGLIHELIGRGHRVVALAPPDEYSPRIEQLGAEFHPIAIDSKGVSPLGDLALLARYHRALRQLRPDVFLGYTIKPNIYGSLAAARLGVPTINNVSGLGTAFIRTGPLSLLVSALYRFALRRSVTVFFQNGDDRNLFAAKSIVRPEQARQLPGSGIDLKRFEPRPLPPHEGVRFLMLGRLLWDKGVREYVEAARIVRSRDPEARFGLLGFVDVANLTAVRKSDVEDWVEEGIIDYMGACEDVRPHLAGADCIVLPSYREGLPRTLLEGAALARPLIATDVPGCRDVVKNGVNGFLCRPRDTASLADAMTRIIEMAPECRQKMGLEGRRMVEARFGQDIVIRAYLEAIEAALAPEPRG